ESEIQTWLDTVTLAEHTYLAPSAARPRKASHFTRPCADDLKEEILHCQALFEKNDMEMLVLDLTRSEIGLPVVKVIVPGLRHFWARFAPGRLYDVAVRLGWLDKPIPEEHLNPIAVFI